MSNYLQHLLTMELDLLDAEKLVKQYDPRFFHPVLLEDKEDNKKKDIKTHYVSQLYGSMILAFILSEDPV